MNIHIYGAYCHGYQIVYKHWNYEIVRETRLHPNLLTDWHDALVGISPRTTQPITTNRHLCCRSERSFFLFGVYTEFIPPILPG